MRSQLVDVTGTKSHQTDKSTQIQNISLFISQYQIFILKMDDFRSIAVALTE